MQFLQGNASVSPTENGFIDSLSLLNSEKAVQEIIQQPMLPGIDDNLIEFSEALRSVSFYKPIFRSYVYTKSLLHNLFTKFLNVVLAVAKALRRVTEGKASAQAEAAEWKRKYELERARYLQLEQKVLSSGGHCSELNVDGAQDLEDQTVLQDENKEQCDLCSGKDICDHQISLKWESPPQTVLILTKPNSTSVRILCFEMVRWLKEQKNLNIFVEPRVKTELLTESLYYSFVQTWVDDEDMLLLHTKVDLVVTLGGDGTVLWAASMFKGPVPPIVPFSLAKSEYENEGPMLVLNEVTIDRGISSFLTNLECYCDESFVTCVQGDGLILSTTSGSTAYSLAAGGSMVHPQVPGILFTPICPHSLSFRPLMLPEHVTLRVVVPFNSRSHAWVSFDGKGRKQLGPGDSLVCSMAPWPVPTACYVDSTSDFLRSIHDGLHWNLRKTQSFDGPRGPNTFYSGNEIPIELPDSTVDDALLSSFTVLSCFAWNLFFIVAEDRKIKAGASDSMSCVSKLFAVETTSSLVTVEIHKNTFN
ncbi:hypothetical protein DH2020_020876 [Rehmannia glutinosa]|uniref:Uncharacterized protein n=1 Tax=Rehmannia glutinosa TaxID=99300 RepID=A0ABR0WB96_REHGL